MKRFISILLILTMILSFSACGDTQNETPSVPDVPEIVVPEKASLQLTVDELPIIDGALACLPFYEKMTALMLDMPLEDARTYILANNTPASYAELAEGKADVIFCAKASEDQTIYAKDRGVEFEYVPFTSDAFVFFVNKNNPVDSLTVGQLHDIYAGKITNWKEVGGKDEAIIAYQRNEGSGSQTGLFEYVISQNEVMEPPTEKRIGEMGAIVDAVSHYDDAQGAIGFSYLYYVKNQHFDEDIKLLKINDVAPDKEHIVSGEYPMLTHGYVVFNKNEAADSTVRKIADWCISDEGQALAESLYYVPVR